MAISATEQMLAAVTAVRDLDVALEGLRSAFAHRYGITMNDSMAMSILAADGGSMTPTEIASRLGVTTGTLTTMLDRLQRVGFVERSPNPRDRRSLLVELSAEGLRTLLLGRQAVHDAVEASIAPDLRPHFVECLTTLSVAIQAGADRLAQHD